MAQVLQNFIHQYRRIILQCRKIIENNFEDCQKELQDEISHHKKYKNKYGKVRRICHTTSTMTGVIPAILSLSGLTVSLSEIGIIAGPPLVGLAALLAPYQQHLRSGAKRLIRKSRSTRKQLKSLKQRTLQ